MISNRLAVEVSCIGVSQVNQSQLKNFKDVFLFAIKRTKYQILGVNTCLPT